MQPPIRRRLITCPTIDPVFASNYPYYADKGGCGKTFVWHKSRARTTSGKRHFTCPHCGTPCR